MPIPAASCPDDLDSDVCCTTVALIAERIRTVTFNAVCGCLEPSCADREFRCYSTVGPNIQEPLGDALIVVMRDLRPTIGSTNLPGRLLPVALYTAEFEVRLLENGWPTIQVHDDGDQIVVPDATIVNNATLHILGHGERMYRALADGIQRRTMFPTATHQHLSEVSLGPLQPVQPTSYLAGYQTRVTVELTL